MGPGHPRFGADIDQKLKALQRPARPFLVRFVTFRGLGLLFFLSVVILATIIYPNRLFDADVRAITMTIGGLAIWRYGWWSTHAMRSEHFVRRVFPKMRRAADAEWEAGWRPPMVHFMMTTYFEKPEITQRVLDGIVRQIRETGCKSHIWIGTGSDYDEKVVRDHVSATARDVDARVSFVRQNQPGKRMAIGIVLRAIRRSGASSQDIIVFMDGDAVLGPGILRKCASLFAIDPELEALTTDEEVICYGPSWMERWLKMRFAQRRVAMQSHAVSGKVLTLTGRMSVFRAKHVLSQGFIRTIEADHLNHWLWGRFRFLSGDDKSSWYYLLTQSAKMTYVPDAMVYTIEVIEGSGTARMAANLKRWSGNMLRNGARAIALGPRRVGPFIWWCLVDQRLAMWTMLVSPTLAIYGTLLQPSYAISAILWILITRILISLFLIRWSREVDPLWPIILYVNQVANALVKVFISFRLSQQVWANRGNQHAGYSGGTLQYAKVCVALFQTMTALGAFLWLMAIWSGFAELAIPLF